MTKKDRVELKQRGVYLFQNLISKIEYIFFTQSILRRVLFILPQD